MFANNRPTPPTPPITSQINVDVRIRGTVTVSEPLMIAGQIDGNIEAKVLHVTSTAVVTGDITAQNIVIDDKVTGKYYRREGVSDRGGAVYGQDAVPVH